jgi:hypothetical protein
MGDQQGRTRRWALAGERTLMTQKRGGNGYLCICASASSALQQNHAEQKKNAKDAIKVHLFPIVLLHICSG